jgi:hypothetical protein
MQQKYLLACILMLPLLLHGMNQVEVTLQVTQKIDNLDDSLVQVVIAVPQLHADKRYKLILPNKESLELSSLHLEQSGYFAQLLLDKSEDEIPLDKGSITTLQGLQELGEILRIIAENKENPAQGLQKFLLADRLSHEDESKRVVYLYEIATYYDIKPLQAVLVQHVGNRSENIPLRFAIEKLPEDWQKELMSGFVKNLLKFYIMPLFHSTGYFFVNSLGWLSHNHILVRTDVEGLKKWHLISNETTDVIFDEEEDALMPLLQECSRDILLSEQMRCFTADNRLFVVNPVDNKCLLRYAPRYIKNIAASPDKSMLACGCIEGSVYIFDTTSWKCLYELEAHVENADIGQENALAWSADGTLLASGGRRTVNVWDIPFLQSVPVKLTVAQLGFLESLVNFPSIPLTKEYEAVYADLPSVWKKLVDERLKLNATKASSQDTA